MTKRFILFLGCLLFASSVFARQTTLGPADPQPLVYISGTNLMYTAPSADIVFLSYEPADSNGNRTAITIGNRSNRGSRNIGPYSMVFGNNSEASAQYSIAAGYNANSSSDYSFTWSGIQSNNPYQSHGIGTFNINPVGGTKGLWIGNMTLDELVTAAANAGVLEINGNDGFITITNGNDNVVVSTVKTGERKSTISIAANAVSSLNGVANKAMNITKGDGINVNHESNSSNIEIENIGVTSLDGFTKEVSIIPGTNTEIIDDNNQIRINAHAVPSFNSISNEPIALKGSKYVKIDGTTDMTIINQGVTTLNGMTNDVVVKDGTNTKVVKTLPDQIQIDAHAVPSLNEVTDQPMTIRGGDHINVTEDGNPNIVVDNMGVTSLNGFTKEVEIVEGTNTKINTDSAGKVQIIANAVPSLNTVSNKAVTIVGSKYIDISEPSENGEIEISSPSIVTQMTVNGYSPITDDITFQAATDNVHLSLDNHTMKIDVDEFSDIGITGNLDNSYVENVKFGVSFDETETTKDLSISSDGDLTWDNAIVVDTENAGEHVITNLNGNAGTVEIVALDETIKIDSTNEPGKIKIGSLLDDATITFNGTEYELETNPVISQAKADWNADVNSYSYISNKPVFKGDDNYIDVSITAGDNNVSNVTVSYSGLTSVYTTNVVDENGQSIVETNKLVGDVQLIAGENIELVVENDTLTINNTFEDVGVAAVNDFSGVISITNDNESVIIVDTIDTEDNPKTIRIGANLNDYATKHWVNQFEHEPVEKDSFEIDLTSDENELWFKCTDGIDVTNQIVFPEANEDMSGRIIVWVEESPSKSNYYDFAEDNLVAFTELENNEKPWLTSTNDSIWKFEFVSYSDETAWDCEIFVKAKDPNIKPIDRGKTTFTLSDGTKAIYDINGTLDRQWMIDNGWYDGRTYKWLVEINSANIGTNVTVIDTAFNKCTNLITVTIPNSIKSIWKYAFCECTNLPGLTIPDNVTSIGEYAFYGCRSLTSVMIPSSVTYIGQFVFAGCSDLTNVIIPDRVTNIGTGMFQDCSGLTSVIIPNSVTSIGQQAFYGCSALTSVTIPSSVTSIGGDLAFYGCSSLMSVTMTGKTTTQVSGMSKYPWGLPSGCVITCSDGTITIP